MDQSIPYAGSIPFQNPPKATMLYFNSYEIIVTGGSAAKGEGLLFFPYLMKRIPVEWTNITIRKGEDPEDPFMSDFGCIVGKGDKIQVQGSDASVLSEDLDKQFTALAAWLNDPGSFTGTFGEALEAAKKKAQELLDKIARGDKITPEDIKGYNSICKAIDKGMDAWLKDIEKAYGNPSSNPEVAQIYNDLVQYRNDLKNEMNCDKMGYLPIKKKLNQPLEYYASLEDDFISPKSLYQEAIFSFLTNCKLENTKPTVENILSKIANFENLGKIECGEKVAGKSKSAETIFLINYPKNCSYILEGAVDNYVIKGFDKQLCPKERFDLMKCLATGNVDNSNENTIIRLIENTSKNHSKEVLEFVKNDATGFLFNLDKNFQLENYRDVFKKLKDLHLKVISQKELDTEIANIDKFHYTQRSELELAQLKTFFWYERTLLKKIWDFDSRINLCKDVKISNTGEISFKYSIYPGDKNPVSINLKPFEVVCIIVRGNPNNTLEADEDFSVYVPAIMLPVLINDRDWSNFKDALNNTLLITGIGSLLRGGTWSLANGGLDVLFGGSALVVDGFYGDISKMKYGGDFLYAYDLINKAFLVYWASRGILQLTGALPKLRVAWRDFKTSEDFSKLRKTNPFKASQIEKEVEEILEDSDEIIYSSINDKGMFKIAYGDDFLSKLVQDFRKTTGKKTGNVAIIEYKVIENGKEVVKTEIGESTGIYNPHAEKAAWGELVKKGIKGEQVIRIFTELEPCMSPGRYCKNFITKTFPNVKTYYSFDYLNGTTENCKKGLSELSEAIKKLF